MFDHYTTTPANISLKIVDNHINDANMIKNSFALHVGLSMVEHILLRCDCAAYWLKDHFFPQDNILFEEETHLTDVLRREILEVLQNIKKWPGIIFKDNTEIRQMLHTRKSSTNSAYGLYVPSSEGDGNIFINLQLIEQAAKTNKPMQSVYGVMIAVKYLHEFAHYIYSKYGRAHLLNVYGIALKNSIDTPYGVLRGESGNRLEEQMLGFILSHAGHLNISMNIKMCLGLWKIADHLRIVDMGFIKKLLRQKTYESSQMKPDFLHYSKIQFCSLEKFSLEKAADVQAFYPANDDAPVQMTSTLPFSLTVDDLTQNDDGQDEKQITAFISLPDKIVL